MRSRLLIVCDLDALLPRLSNWGRWGAADQRGTLNYITADSKTRKTWPVPRVTHFEILSLHTHPHLLAQNDGGKGAQGCSCSSSRRRMSGATSSPINPITIM